MSCEAQSWTRWLGVPDDRDMSFVLTEPHASRGCSRWECDCHAFVFELHTLPFTNLTIFHETPIQCRFAIVAMMMMLLM